MDSSPSEEHIVDMSSVPSAKVTSRDIQLQKLMQAAAQQSPTWLANILNMLVPVVGIISNILNIVMPYVSIIFGFLQNFFTTTSRDILEAMYGALLCFFGGHFPSLIIAVETFRQTGWAFTKQNLIDLYAEWNNVRKADAEDNMKDENNDGTADVHQIGGQQLFTRKVALFMRSINTERVSHAGLGLWAGFLSVVGALRMHFAQVLALGSSVGEQLEKLANAHLAPPLAQVLPAEQHKWIPMGLRYLCKTVGVSFGWIIQRILSQTQSAIQGGLMCSRGILRTLNDRGIMRIDIDQTMLDEYLGWALAALGFWFQGVAVQTAIPFPLSVICWPLSLVEFFLRYVITLPI